MPPKTQFPVEGRTVVITGGSRGMGLAVGRQLAEKGANVAVIARDYERLLQAVEHMRQGAQNPQDQRFIAIRADLTLPSEATRVIDEVVSWNLGSSPDIVWCCAGSTHPTLFVDTPVSEFQKLMSSNYFTSLYMTHAVLTLWLKKPSRKETASIAADATTDSATTVQSSAPSPPPARHIIFTASFLALYSFTGYSPYSPSKAALRSLCDSLSQEMNLYAAAHPHEPPVRLHTIFPAGITGESFDAENRIKPDITKLLEAGDKPQTPEVIARKSIQALESGHELITTDFLTALVKRSMLGGSTRGGFFKGLGDWLLACLLAVVMVFVRGDMDKKVRDWGRKFGDSGNQPSRV
ncbi:hypothetical protein K445DRAFT_323108 [Daldinia sp. EC12]|nr:hypothetical protein K445DRAFT_323108 [Daldinia sp. EC12]